MKRIVLTQGKVALVDDEDFERLNQFKWYAKKHRNTFYAGRNSPWINGKHYQIMMHWEIIGRPPKGMMSDHCNGCGIDNQRSNLRFVTNRQNQQNMRNTNKSSRYPGVSWFKARKKWRVQIKINGIQKHLGLFTDEYEAFEVYRQTVNDIDEKVVGGIV